MPLRRKVADAGIARLSTYNQVLVCLSKKGVEIISSQELGEQVGCSGAQIRGDLSCFGEFGETGKGYYVTDLKDAISRILGTDRKWHVALVGVGNLGSALLAYPGFRDRGFDIAAVFDNDLRKIGKRWEDVTIQDISELPDTVKEREIRIGVIAVPPAIAQTIADMLISSGVRAILNFAPARVTVPDEVNLRDADLATELECLSYFLANEARVRSELFVKMKDGSGGER
ncbi:MAG: redox-sensing transcriptional repressor Rex [Candidatus Latescibacterota bacterium]